MGAGYGIGTKVFSDHGYQTEAVEAEDDEANYAGKYMGIPVHAVSIEEFIARGRRSYGLIIFAQCLEHVDDPASVMAGMCDLLDPEAGILYVEVPVVWSIVTWSDALYLTHKSNFTERNLVALSIGRINALSRCFRSGPPGHPAASSRTHPQGDGRIRRG